jgi:DNA-binding SARP family transcriptional activator
MAGEGRASTLNRLKIRLFGGFEVQWQETLIDSFESQKVRALLAFLAYHRSQPFSRERISALLWPEVNPDSARRNLRQALYSLRRVLAAAGESQVPGLIVAHQTVQLGATPDIWVDTVEFREHLQAAPGSDGRQDMRRLAAAVQLYTGDLLAGFHVKDCPPFEDWWLQEHEQLKEAAVGALRSLVDYHFEEGAYSLGVKYARQLLRIDPLSEDAYRSLMRLHAFAGRRGRAIAVYQELSQLLNEELGVPPAEETVADYQAILDEELPGPAVTAQAELTGPVIPLVGREKAIQQLRQSWSVILEGKGHLTLVVGEEGVGKTRLLRSFLHEATGKSEAFLLRGRFRDFAVPAPFDGLREALSNVVAHEPELMDRVLPELPERPLTTLSALAPSLRELRPQVRPLLSAENPQTLAQALFQFFTILGRPGAEPDQLRPIILFLDDLHLADEATLQVLLALEALIADLPVWIVAALDSGPAARDGLQALLGIAAARGRVLPLERLTEADAVTIARSLLNKGQQHRLVRLLPICGGLPLRILELINLLWDRRILQESLRGDPLEMGNYLPDFLSFPPGFDGGDFEKLLPFERLMLERLAELPASTRRLVTLAAVAGDGFDAQLLQSAESEHETVVEIGLKLLVEHWFIRHNLGYWADSRRQRDIALWAGGPRAGEFEFIHSKVRRAIYDRVAPQRRCLLHGRIARVLSRRLREGEESLRLPLAHHLIRAGEVVPAVEQLQRAAVFAQRFAATEAARETLEMAERLIEERAVVAVESETAQRIASLRRAVARELRELRESSSAAAEGERAAATSNPPKKKLH